MLLGTYTHTVDSKGRVFLPAKWRAELGETVIISQATTDIRRGIGLELMSLEAYDIRKRNLINVSDDNIEATNLKRAIMYTTSDCDIDKQGRILIPQLLREIAKINEEVILVGMHQSVEQRCGTASTMGLKTILPHGIRALQLRLRKTNE